MGKKRLHPSGSDPHPDRSKNKKKKKKTTDASTAATAANSNEALSTRTTARTTLPFDFRYIVAPMVGASELPFRLLCRKYGAQLAYTPMMLASEFATSKDYRKREFQTTPFDRPLVCHFAANHPKDFAKAAQLAEPFCDAIDLNLGCPQRTASVGCFGSYLLDPKDRDLVLDIVRAGAKAVQIPIFVKIRLLDTVEDTTQLIDQLYKSGATLIAIHARYRATFHRKGAGARDGPALLDQVQQLKQTFRNQLLITNGNTITYEDVQKNLLETQADGIMSAEGILDNPALFLERLKPNTKGAMIGVKGGSVFAQWPAKQKLLSKLSKIDKLEQALQRNPKKSLTEKETTKITKKCKLLKKLRKIDEKVISAKGNDAVSTVTFDELFNAATDRVGLALEYLRLARQYPTALRSVIFHTRRILKAELTTFQLLQECISSESIDTIENVVKKLRGYQRDPASFRYDVAKAQEEKEALDRKHAEEGKRKAFEARMMRKAKREGRLDDLDYYLRQGAIVPSLETVQHLRTLDKPQQLLLWKQREHSQHCMTFHLNNGECARGRSCAFLHVASSTSNTFDEQDEVAG